MLNEMNVTAAVCCAAYVKNKDAYLKYRTSYI